MTSRTFLKTERISQKGSYKDRHNVYLLSILIIAIVLRVWLIDQPYIDVLSWRQTSTAMMAENFFKTNSNIFYPQVNWSGPGPSYNGREFQTISYISALLYHVFGQHDWIGRLVAVIFGVWGIFAFFRLVEIVWNSAHALAGAFVMAVMPLSILVDRSFIPDPVMVALVVTFLWLFVRYLQTQEQKYLVLSALFGCLGFLTKLPGMLIGLPALYAFIHISKAGNQLTAFRTKRVVFAGVIVFIPVVLYYLWARHLSVSYAPYHFAGAGNWVWNEGLASWVSSKYFLGNFYRIAQHLMWGPVISVLFFLGLLSFPLSIKKADEIVHNAKAPYFFHFWLLAFAFFYAIGARELTTNFWNFHIIDPVIAAFAGRSIVSVFNFQRKRKLFPYSGIVVIGVLLLLSSYVIMKRNHDEQTTISGYKMAQDLKNISKEDDLVVTLPELCGDPFPIFYSHRHGWTFPPMELDKKLYETSKIPDTSQECIDIIELLRNRNAKWFAVVQKQINLLQDESPEFYKYLNKNFRVAIRTNDYIIFDISILNR